MRKSACCTLGLLAASGMLHADWKITTESVIQGRRTTITEYYKDNLLRMESSSEGHTQVSVRDKATGRQFMWDVERRQYTIMKPRPARADLQPAAQNGPAAILRVERTSTDTGERDTLFGFPASHFITTEKRYFEKPAGAEPQLESESTEDAWYVDTQGLPREKSASIFYYGLSGNQPPKIEMRFSGPRPRGIAVRQRIKNTSYGSVFRLSREVTELTQCSLASDFFEPPTGFQQVNQLAMPMRCQPNFFDQVELYWNQLLDYLSGWFS